MIPIRASEEEMYSHLSLIGRLSFQTQKMISKCIKPIVDSSIDYQESHQLHLGLKITRTTPNEESHLYLTELMKAMTMETRYPHLSLAEKVSFHSRTVLYKSSDLIGACKEKVTVAASNTLLGCACLTSF